MKQRFTYSLFFSFFLLPVLCFSQGEPFTITELNTKSGSGNYHLMHPFDIVYGPDNFLYITEKRGRVLRVDTGSGVRQVLLDHRSQVAVNATTSSVSQHGMLGLALHPHFNEGTGQDSIFVVYSYTNTQIRISRFRYNGSPTFSLTGETVLIEGIPASSDHSSGRLIVGADEKLYYTCGDLGNNQFGNKCNFIRSQDLPTAGDISIQNYTNYSGKILRLNLDGSIPSDNPLWNGVQSHIYTIGHRNPQGLVWEKNPSNGYVPSTLMPGGKLFSSEHGPNTDDEINLIESGRNYGWPYIAGEQDGSNYRYVQWATATNCNGISYVEDPMHTPSGATVVLEASAPASVTSNFQPPMKAVYTDCGSQPASECEIANGWLKYPTIAPSSVEFYNLNAGRGIPNWYPSLLVPTLRTGTVFRFRLNATRDAIIGDSIPYFTAVNRYRDIALSPDGKIFLITDSVGSTSGPSGSNASNLVNRGSILLAQYTGATLPLQERPGGRTNPDFTLNVYPNPATSVINVELKRVTHMPVRYRIYDIAGKLVQENTSSKANFTINVDQMKRGMYILRLYNGYDIEMRMDKIVLK